MSRTHKNKYKNKSQNKAFQIKDIETLHPLNDRQEQLLEALQEDDKIVGAIGFAGTGKAQPYYSNVKTINGWENISNLKEGDEILCPDGTKTKINGFFPQGEKEIFEITFEDNRKVHCCYEHLWKIYNKEGTPKVIETKDLELNDSIPLIQHENKERSYPSTNFYHLGEIINQENIHIFDAHNLRNIIHEANYKEKLSLIQGLMDSKGKIENELFFETTSYKLKNKFIELIYSIGGKAFLYELDDYYKIEVHYHEPIKLFQKTEKRNQIQVKHWKSNKLQIRNIEKIGKEECYCISVDHPDQLYITDHYIVTHNTMLSIYNSLRKVLDERTMFDKLVIVRSVVQSRDVGFLPGVIDEKIEPFEEVYKNIFDELFQYSRSYEHLKNNGKVEFETTSFLRGKTLDRSIIVVDEAANMNFQELDLIMSRIGIDSKLILCGDVFQSDLNKKNDQSGLSKLLDIFDKMKNVSVIEFEKEDVVRSDIVKEYLIAKEQIE